MVPKRQGFVYVKDSFAKSKGFYYSLGLIVWGLGGWLIWLLGPNLVLDTSSPDFNPFIFLVPLLAGVGLISMGHGAAAQIRNRKWSGSVLEMPEKGPRMGSQFSGRIFGPAVEPTTGRYSISMRLVETFYVDERPHKQLVQRENVRWEERISVEASLYPLTAGVPFSVALPPMKQLRREVSDSSVKVQGAIHVTIPGMQSKSFAHNVLPDEVRWVVEISAPVEGLDYKALFDLKVEPGFPVR